MKGVYYKCSLCALKQEEYDMEKKHFWTYRAFNGMAHMVCKECVELIPKSYRGSKSGLNGRYRYAHTVEVIRQLTVFRTRRAINVLKGET